MSDFKLYYTTTSCGAASFLTASIGGLSFDSETVNLRQKTTQSGADFTAVNPKGNVPAIAFDDGTLLNENVAALTFLADTGNAGLAPKEGTKERYQYLNHLGFINSELHPSFGPLFRPGLSAEARESAVKNLGRKFDKFTGMLKGKPYLNGTSMSSADIYASVVLSWAGFLDVALPEAVQAYADGIQANPELQTAKAAMAAAQV